MAQVSDEPVRATSVTGPALLAAVVLLLTHAAASALLTVLASTFTPGAGAPGGAWRAGLWLSAAALAAASLRPILRRVSRPLAVGAVAGAISALAYAALAIGLAAPGESTPMLWGRVASIAIAGMIAGALTSRS